MAGVATPVVPEKRMRTRSPAYPYINLETALARAKIFYEKEQRNAANINVVSTHWGVVEGGSSGAQMVAALIYFGLMSDEGVGDKRKVRLSQPALKILLDTRPDSAERAELVRQAALSPKIHHQLWEKWQTDLPSDVQLRHTLLFDWPTPFNENAVDSFIREYRDTIAFAKLTKSDTVKSEVEDNGGEGAGEYVPKVGDYVQWESRGMVQFESKRVREVSPDGKFAFVDGQYSGLPVGELSRVATPSGAQVIPDPVILGGRTPPPPKTYTMQEFVVPLSDGSRAVFAWPTLLSPEDIIDLQDSLKILERKITRSVAAAPGHANDEAKQ